MSAVLARAPLLIVLVLSVLLMFLDLGSNSLHNQDEALHAVVAREAASHGSWLPLTYMGQPYFNKPPLRIWLTALSFRLAGQSEWTVRFASAFFGLATVLVLFLVGRRLFGERIAFLSSLILLTSHQYLYNHCARTGETDSMLIFCWTAALLLLQLSVQEADRRALFAAAALLGLCGMVKHLGFVPLLLLIAVGSVLLSGHRRAFPVSTWLTGLGIAVAVVLPWHLVMAWMEGEAFTRQYFLGEVLEKRLQARGGGTRLLSAASWSPLLTLARGFFPWSCLLPFALASAVARREIRSRLLTPTLWLLVVLAATIVSERKFSWYVLPAFPAAAILVASLVDRFLEASSPRWIRLSVTLGGMAALTSVTDAGRHNPFGVLARDAMVSVDFLGRLSGAGLSMLASLTMVLGLTCLITLLAQLPTGLGRSPFLRLALARLLIAALVAQALYNVIVPLRFSPTISPLHQMARSTRTHLSPGENLNVVLPRRKIRNPRFNFYFGERNLRILPDLTIAAQNHPGELLLTDVATVDRAQQVSPDPELPVRPVARAKGLLLLRLRRD